MADVGSAEQPDDHDEGEPEGQPQRGADADQTGAIGPHRATPNDEKTSEPNQS